MKNGLPPGLLADDLGERLGGRHVFAQRIGDETRATCGAPSGRRSIEWTGTPCFSCSREREHERVSRRHLVVAIGHHDQQRLRRRRRHDQVDEVQAGRVRPLHVVEKQHERMRRLQNTCTKLWKTRLNRFCASNGSSSGTRGCGPMMSSSAGTTSTMSCPFG